MPVLLGITKKIELLLRNCFFYWKEKKYYLQLLELAGFKLKKGTKERFRSLVDVHEGIENLFPLLKQKFKLFNL